ncbi:MAG: glycosyltransferase family 4 protein [candidate division WOR-3 bacterium]|nr:glycosyltransferase family 4 protein [candidate division WOR-3 bacterium]
MLSQIVLLNEKAQVRDMKIAIDALAAKSLYHGMGNYVFNIIKHLSRLSLSNHFLVFKRPNLFSEYNLTNVCFKEIKLPLPLRILWEHLCLPSKLKKEEVDLFWGPSNFLPPRKVCLYVVTIHDLSSFTLPETYSYLRRRYYQEIITTSVRLSDFIITDSEASKRDMLTYFNMAKDKIRVIYCGLNEIFFNPPSQESWQVIKNKYHLPEEYLFTLGVLEPKKNTTRLLLAYAQLKNNLSFLPPLVIGGSRRYGWKNSSLFRMVKELCLTDSVIFTDFIEQNDLPLIYANARIFVFPSLYEGFGLPVIEAMACGVPVITSNTSSLPEIAGDAAIFVNPYDVNEISQAIKQVLTNEHLQNELREKGIENAKRFSWKNTASGVLEVLEKVLKQ